MSRRLEWILLTLLAVAGFALVVYRAPQQEPFLPNQLIPSRDILVRRAEAVVRSFGYDVTGWTHVVTSDRNRDLRITYSLQLVQPAWQLRRPEQLLVTFLGPNRENCKVELDTANEILLYHYNPLGEAEASQMVSDGSAEDARRLALETFATRWKPSGRAADLVFQLTADAVAEDGGYAFEWTSEPEPGGLLAWRVNMLVRDQRIHRFEVAPIFLEALERRLNAEKAAVEPAILVIFVAGFALMIVAAVLALINLFRGRLPWVFVARTASLMGMLLLFDAFTGQPFSIFRLLWQDGLLEVAGLGVGYLSLAGAACALACAGRSVRSMEDFRRWMAMEDFLRLSWGKASVIRSFWVAGLLASVCAGISYAVMAFTGSGLMDSVTLEPITQPVPLVNRMFSQRTFSTLLVIMFLFPLLKTYVKNWMFRAGIALLASTAGAAFLGQVAFPFSAALVDALLVGLLLVYAYWRFGVLAAVLAPLLAEPLARAVVFFSRGELALQAWGAGFLSISLLILAVCLFLDQRNPDRAAEQRLSEEEFAALKRESERQLLSRRETLLGEFALAQRAQQRMLPARPPVLPGFEVASVCLPAQQVGGDLFDYIRLSDSRMAFCVADVSGKGVSAALYMTMIKGMLNALRLERADLLDIVTALNQRVYEVMRRRSFVTMVLAALDSASRTLEILRAGHLPVLHVSAKGETRFVSAQGMGLGLAPSTLFCRSLNTTQLKLHPGEVAVLYSDGVTEAMNEAREEFGEERLASAVAGSVHLPAAEIRTRLLSTVREFQRTAPPHDDMTIVVLKAMAASPRQGGAA